jgi:hypothetical protein
VAVDPSLDRGDKFVDGAEDVRQRLSHAFAALALGHLLTVAGHVRLRSSRNAAASSRGPLYAASE